MKTSLHYRGTVAEIHLPFLRHNVNVLRASLSENDFFCPMVKANGYGHGDSEISRELEELGVTNLGVVSIEEAIRLRNSGIKANILCFGFFDHDGAQAVLEYQITPVLSDFKQIDLLEKAVSDEDMFKVHIKFNTGMNRVGFHHSEAEKLADYFSKSKRIKLDGICTHLLNGEDFGLSEGYSAKQLELYETILQQFRKRNVGFKNHWMNSSAMLIQNKMKLSIKELGARPGLSMYGLHSPTHNQARMDLKPVMHLKTRILDVHNIKAGEVVSYGGTWRAQRDSRIALIPIGYADGYQRALSNKAQVLVCGVKAPVTGIVCMDYTMIDVTDVPATDLYGEEVVLFGTQQRSEITVQDLANWAGTIPYELLVRIGSRIPRVVKHF